MSDVLAWVAWPVHQRGLSGRCANVVDVGGVLKLVAFVILEEIPG